jgi:hypothetical protein
MAAGLSDSLFGYVEPRQTATMSPSPLMEATPRAPAATLGRMHLPRRVALLGGTTTWDDCAVGLRYLANPGDLVQGPAISAYEQCFAETIGVRYAYSDSLHGRDPRVCRLPAGHLYHRPRAG